MIKNKSAYEAALILRKYCKQRKDCKECIFSWRMGVNSIVPCRFLYNDVDDIGGCVPDSWNLRGVVRLTKEGKK